MELIIKDFLTNFSLIQCFIIDLYSSIESSKGIYTIYIYSFPYFTVNIITNDFITLNSINKFSYNRNIGDLIAILGSIDFVYLINNN